MREYQAVKLWTNVSEKDWDSWEWQLQNRITSVDKLSQILNLSLLELENLEICMRKFKMSITPYYASLMNDHDPLCPIRRQALPSFDEMGYDPSSLLDPTYEEKDSPVPYITHRYPDRVLFLVTSECATYCRHCTRKRFVGETNYINPNLEDFQQAFNYIEKNVMIRDVIVSGGDPLLLSDSQLEVILRKLRNIQHVEIIRIGTRIPVVLPQRINKSLCDLIKKFHPIFINTHFNHPKELTPTAEEALAKLANSGIPLGNQSVLLRGINDCPNIIKKLCHKLIYNRVRPYYLYQCDRVTGVSHFCTTISKGIEIMESLRGHTSGLCIPSYVVETLGGGGKCPILPQYLISYGESKAIFRNYEGVFSSYIEPNYPISDCSCEYCQEEKHQKKHEIIGLRKLLLGKDNIIEPCNLIRKKRRREGENE